MSEVPLYSVNKSGAEVDLWRGAMGRRALCVPTSCRLILHFWVWGLGFRVEG